jgi:hypothetical protein
MLFKAVSLVWLGFGCIAAIGLMRNSDAQFVGQLLIIPAVVLGLLKMPAGIMFTLQDGWPVLTSVGVGLVYIVPAVGVLFAATKRQHPGAPQRRAV